MALLDATRERRVRIWKAHKETWESKLASATSQNDTAVAKLMISEAEDALNRLKGKEDEKAEDKKQEGVKGKTKITPVIGMDARVSTDKYPHKDKDSTDTTGTIGL